MYPGKNIDRFIEENCDSFYGRRPENSDTDYMTFMQTRLNTNLLLLSNPELIASFGLSYEQIVEETKNLFAVTKYVKIPEVVPEKKSKR
ncbi:MAG: hypothetical protein IKR74_00470 [Bacilli bacterium]|nr:hypothetical protein [Bacilli bacterium]